MSGRPSQSVPKSMARRLSWTLAVVTALLLSCCGLSLGFAQYSDRNESREADKEVDRYLTLVQGRDRAGADVMLCGGDDTSAVQLPGMNQPNWHLPLVESFTIVNTWDWSSVTDGHGRGYQVRLVFADRSTAKVEMAVEVIADDPCIATEIRF